VGAAVRLEVPLLRGLHKILSVTCDNGDTMVTVHLFIEMSTKTEVFENLDMMKIVRLEVFTAVTMQNGVFWDVTLCCSCKNRRFGGT
jgi:hypothetical protein